MDLFKITSNVQLEVLREDTAAYKIEAKGAKHLTDCELWQLVLRSSSNNLGKARLLASDASLDRMSVKELQNLGFSIAESKSVRACFVLAERMDLRAKEDKVVIRGSQSAFNVLRPYLSNLAQEEVYVLLLNRPNNVLAVKHLSKGGVHSSIVDVKVLFSHAVTYKASSMILAHNHPSGSCRPSEADKQITRKVKELGEMMDVKLLDHLILADGRFLSFADEGEL